GDLLTHQNAAPAGLGTLPDDDLDGVGAAKVVRVHPIAGGEDLVDQLAGVLALLRKHAAVPGGRAGADRAGAPAERLLGGRRERAEAHPRDRDRDLQVDRLCREPGAEGDVGGAALPVALERVSRDARPEEEEVVEVRDTPLGAEA